jgi:hypothetical protein
MSSNIRINLDKSIPSTVPNTDSLALGTLAVGLDSFERVTGKKVAYCGECNRRVSWDSTSKPPRVCRKCGLEFNWDRMHKRKVMICPVCKNKYDLDDEFCGQHFPAVRLENGYE